MNEHISNKNDTNEMDKNKEMIADFDYSKLTEEAEAMSEYLEQLSEEVIKMKVECAIANIELASTIDGIDFESKIKDLEKNIEGFIRAHLIESKGEQIDDEKLRVNTIKDVSQQ